MLTPTIEDYLFVIHTLENESEGAIGARIARLLGVKPSTVTAALRRMERDGLVEFQPGKRIAPTEKGRRQVERLLRRHRLLERWLADVLGVSWHRCHQDAHRLEHGVTDEIADRLSESLGNPATCPHGNPIPGNAGAAEGERLVRLSEAPAGKALVIRRISELNEEDPGILEYFDRHGLLPGATLTIRRMDPVNRLVVVQLSGGELALSRLTAGKIEVSGTRG